GPHCLPTNTCITPATPITSTFLHFFPKLILTILVYIGYDIFMLRINRRTDYAIRTMVAIAQAPEDAYISTPDIGAAMLIPRPFLVIGIAELKRGVLVKPPVGRTGGITLALPAD